MKVITSVSELRNPTDKYMTATITAKLLATLKPVCDQFEDGVKLVNKNRVKELKTIGMATVLEDSEIYGPIVLHKGRVSFGNHRTVATTESIEENSLDPNFLLQVKILPDSMSPDELSKKTYRANLTSVKTNYKAHALNSKMAITKQLFAPIYKAFKQVGYEEVPADQIKKVVQALGAVIHENQAEYERVIKGQRMTVPGDAFYYAKNSPAGNNKFDSVVTKCDLRGSEANIQKLIEPFLITIKKARAAGIIGGKLLPLGSNTMIYNTILGLSVRGQLSFDTRSKAWTKGSGKTVITINQLLSALKNNSVEIKESAKNYNDGTDRENEILKTLETETNCSLRTKK